MSKLWLIGLAASAAWTQAASAHDAAPAPTPPPMGHGAHAPMPMPGAPMMRHRMNPMPMPGHHKGFKRIGRGFILPPMFMGPQFMVHDWRGFGFPAPMPGGRWVRYYDDALMIDRDGRVMDTRYGWDWDGRGGRHDEDYGDEDYADDRDYDDRDYDDRDMRHHGRDRVVMVRRDGKRGDCGRRCAPVRHIPAPPPMQHGYGYGYGYGYGGYGCGCGPVVITETTTTTAPVVEKHVYYETVTTHRAAPRRYHAKPKVRTIKPVRRAAPAPRPGERG